MTVTAANEHDMTQAAELIRDDDEVVYGDSGYLGIEKRPEVISDEHSFRIVVLQLNSTTESSLWFFLFTIASSFYNLRHKNTDFFKICGEIIQGNSLPNLIYNL